MAFEVELIHPEPLKKKTKIFPVFLPFSGCPNRCVYCDQSLQTGTKTRPLSVHLERFKRDIADFFSSKRESIELGFFGGTFTGIDQNIALEFLKIAKSYKDKGLISKIRCSTRPDFIDETKVKLLKEHGLDLIELGVQSFDEKILKITKRGYTKHTVFEASRIIKKSGLGLGVQLMPGLPLMDSHVWMRDISYTLELHPDVVRIYPCVIIKNTELERWYVDKKYTPWTLQGTVKRVARGVLKLWKNKIYVIRIGLPPQKEILEKIVAGPWHPALGNMVRGYIFKKFMLSVFILQKVKKVKKIYIPKRLQGDFFGFKGENLSFFKKFGIDKYNIYVSQEEKIKMVVER